MDPNPQPTLESLLSALSLKDAPAKGEPFACPWTESDLTRLSEHILKTKGTEAKHLKFFARAFAVAIKPSEEFYTS